MKEPLWTTILTWTGSLVCLIPLHAANLLEAPESQHIPFPDPRLKISGLPWFEEDKPDLRRLPLRLKNSFREPVWSLAQQPSGGRIRFKTDSTRIGIRGANPDTSGMYHMTTIGQSGLDLYVANEYRASAWPDKDATITKEWAVGQDRGMRDITIYLPLYKGITLKEIVLDAGAKIEAPSRFALDKSVVFYGSSITQGGCASNPGMSYEAQVARWLNLDFVNLGFSGNGLGEPAVADAVSEIDAACFVLDYWGNPSPEVYAETLPKFVGTLRKKHPRTPILIPSPYFIPSGTWTTQPETVITRKRKTAETFVRQQRSAGDRLIFYIDGLEMLPREHADGLVDGVHCNSLGFYFCAKGIEPHLRQVLKLGSQKVH